MKHTGTLSVSTLAIAMMVGTGSALAAGDHSGAGHEKMAMESTQHTTESIQGKGQLNAIHTEKYKVTISHAPIPVLGWPSMRMDFAVKPNISLHGLKVGQQVAFALEKAGEYDYAITAISPLHGN